ncbi:rhamnulokinase [Marvinbryantia formatexigens DSM 14469]|uniref:Rhamnulokinase n=1 Tax=Marvinbryantia formatexigens DSM 14469 TaxID=478749 RepID=C6LDH0_9FIRM|nr:rhamnulokinase [Marvinbryantia formatexigens]EET61405.1 rhamnulokinase [Marvinbryantia formatexigens DSM 14469]UWO26077.1 rhamnulokinase [Marvinbryantia formatexigens DSM 14469]SDF90171.1 rhamnulokinase [Marvinbryantia formatexigens]
MAEYYLAVDLGASGGRHMLGHLEEGRLHLEEVYRFENKMTNKDGKLLWDLDRLFREILNGMKKCREAGKIPVSMSIDTWAVDYVLLDEQDRILGDTYGYRDSRTQGMDEAVWSVIPEKELYARSGIQKQPFNTIYQLMAVKKRTPELLEQARTFLMLPDYFQFLLTGNRVSEYTNATSTQLVNPETKQWDRELMSMLGYPEDIFLPLKLPGWEVGTLRPEIQNQVGYNCRVVLCASHDTASAVMAMPEPEGQGIYISSGTWSLMGCELPAADCREESRQANFTNEGGYDYRFRYLKNIMGLWMIQSVRREWDCRYSFAEICDMAEQEAQFPSRVDVNDACFLAPASMTEAVREYCRKSGQKVPETPGQMAAVIYQSLAASYRETVLEIEKLTGRNYDRIYIIGGGSNAGYLNRLTADATGKEVYAGPSEATAIGNILAQMQKDGKIENLSRARACVRESFEIRRYSPANHVNERK